MKNVKLFAILACLVFAFSAFALACTPSEPSSDPESTPSSELVSTPESEPSTEPESQPSTEPESQPTESQPDPDPVTYCITFMADGAEVEKVYYLETDTEIDEPDVPAKDGYVAAWEEYTLGGDDTVNAVYTAIVYTIHFDVEGVEDITFTIETIDQVEFPAAPEKDGYQVTWSISEEDLGLEDVTVTVVEERLYTVKFVGIDGIEDIVVPESQLDVNNLPAAPVKDGYVTGWEEPVLDADNATVTVTYWEMTEREYYTRDIVGAEMVSVFAPTSDANSIAWDETEKAYHFVNNDQVDDNRALTFERNYIIKLAELGVKSISFEVKLDDYVEGETLYRGFYPDWWTANWGVDIWQISDAQDWIQIIVNMSDLPMASDGALKTIFMLGDKGSGLWIRNVEICDPDFDNLTDRDFVNAFSIHHLASTNKVSWDETENAVLFTNNVTDEDDKRGFWMGKDFTDAIKARAASITFKVKFVGERAVTGKDNSLYVINGVVRPDNGWFNWGSAQQVGYAESGWVDVLVPITEDIHRIALLCTSGSFYVKDITLIAPEFIPELDELTHENFAKMFNPLAAGSSVVWDETEGAFRFIVDDTAAFNGDNSRAFILNPEFMAKLREAGVGLSFKVKFLNSVNPSLNQDGTNNDDKSLYVSYSETNANKWWGNHTGVGWEEDSWVDVSTTFNSDESLTLMLLNCTDDFLLKDFVLTCADSNIALI
ncbi:MAG: hypothetical protein IJY84_02460 [Clostridia bacterium]|nr:hypothetical protein [Clostridia bacterium]